MTHHWKIHLETYRHNECLLASWQWYDEVRELYLRVMIAREQQYRGQENPIARCEKQCPTTPYDPSSSSFLVSHQFLDHLEQSGGFCKFFPLG
jgi:hypothetical protein